MERVVARAVEGGQIKSFAEQLRLLPCLARKSETLKPKRASVACFWVHVLFTSPAQRFLALFMTLCELRSLLLTVLSMDR